MHYEPPERRGPASSQQRSPNSSVDQTIVALSTRLRAELEAAQRGSCGADGALETAWRILRVVGLKDFGAIRSRRTSDYPGSIEPHYARPVALALRTLGTLLYHDRSKGLDRAAQVLDRAVALAPDDPDCVEDFGDVACRITPDDIRGFNDQPQKKLETVIGFIRSANKATSNLLERGLGISSEVITQQSGDSLYRILSTLESSEKAFVARSLNRLGWLFLHEGCFFRNGTLLGFAVAASCSHLQALGLPRGAMDCVTALREAVESCSIIDDLGSDLPAVRSSLDVLSAAFFEKGKLFNNDGARRRSERIDSLLDAIDHAEDRKNNQEDGQPGETA